MNVPRIRIACASGALLLSLGTLQTATAADPNSFSANIGAVSNYMWRGVSQTQDGPAIQGGLDYAHASGFYLGTWASNVDWNNEGAPQIATAMVDADGLPILDDNGYPIYETLGASNPDSPTYEIDLYTGFGGKIGEDWKWDINAILYAYPDGRDVNFGEIGGKLTYRWITAGLAYTAWGEADGGDNNQGVLFYEGDLYSFGAIDFALPYDFAFNAHGGYYAFRNSNGQSYGTWGVSISRTVGDYGTVSFNYDQNGGNQEVWDTDPKVWVGWKKTF
jgi:hypothetical protein